MQSLQEQSKRQGEKEDIVLFCLSSLFLRKVYSAFAEWYNVYAKRKGERKHEENGAYKKRTEETDGGIRNRCHNGRRDMAITQGIL